MKHALLILISLATSVLAYERLQGPTELLYWDKTNAYNGYTLFGSHGTTYLIDMSGQVIHTWRLGTNPRFLDNGHILDASKDDPSGFLGFVEVDWDGKKVWEYTENREGYAPHHDWVRVFNKQLNAWTTMYIANKSISHEQAIAAGADPRKGPYAGGQMDTVVEVDMDGNVVWEWWFLRPRGAGCRPRQAQLCRPGEKSFGLPEPDRPQHAGQAAETGLAALQLDGLQCRTGPGGGELCAGRIIRHRPWQHLRSGRSQSQPRQGGRTGGRFSLPVWRSGPLWPGRAAARAGKLG
jgi:hypothetical protein